jgi:hypothetical protein
MCPAWRPDREKRGERKVRNIFALGAALLLLGSGLLGCGNKEEPATAPPNVPQAGGKDANKGATGATNTPATDFTSDAGIQSAVKKGLEENADVKDTAAKITIEVKDKLITLKGEVPDNDTKRKVGEAVTATLKTNNAPADIKVNNALVSHKH